MKTISRINHLYQQYIYLILSILLIISTLTLISCNSFITDVNPSLLPSTDSKLVVACFISPQDTVLSAKVTETKTVLGTGGIKADITSASISLSDGSKLIKLVYDSSLTYYKALPSQLPIVAGKTYTLTVSTADGRKVTATATVPLSIAIKEMKFDSAIAISTRKASTQQVTEYTIKLIWQDYAGTADYYRGFGYAQGLGVLNNGGAVQTQTNGFDFFSTNDQNSDGQLMSLSVTYQPFSRNITKYYLQKMRIGLFHTDVNYFNYHESLRKQRGNNNPFAEPVLLYTNIQGGFGCFGAYNATWQNIKIN